MKTHSSQLTAHSSKGFTLIEIIVTITLIAIIMIPISLMTIEFVRSIAYADSLTMAASLAKRETAIINNLNYSDPTLADGYNNITTGYAGYGYDLRRTVNTVAGSGGNLKRVRVRLFRSGSTEQLIEVDTYVEGIAFGLGGGTRSGYFTASGGSFASPSLLSNISLQNSNATDTITMVGVIMNPSKNQTLSSITMGGLVRYSISTLLSSGQDTQISFQNNFVMAPNTTYSGANGGAFSFSSSFAKNNTVTITFIFNDGSQSASIQWKR